MRVQRQYIISIVIAIALILVGFMGFPLAAIIPLMVIPGLGILSSFRTKDYSTVEKIILAWALTNILHLALYFCALIDIPITKVTIGVVYCVIPLVLFVYNTHVKKKKIIISFSKHDALVCLLFVVLLCTLYPTPRLWRHIPLN